MIRPVTVATFLLACGSGLYLYQSKHEVQVLDRTIERSVRDTDALREQSRILAAEWKMLNDPDRLRQFSDTYLQLKAITPSQYTSLTDLDNRLPAPRIETPSQDPEEESVPVTVDNGPQPIAASGPAAVLPVPPVPGAHAGAPAVASAPRATDIKAPDVKLVTKPQSTDTAPHAAMVAESRPADSRVTEAHAAQRMTDPRAAARDLVAPPPRPIVLAPPRPVPVNASMAAGTGPVRPQMPSVLAAKVPASLPAPVALASPAHVALVSASHVALVSSTHVALATPAATPVQAAPRPAQTALAAPAPASGYGGSLLGMARGGLSPSLRPMPVNASYGPN